MEFKQFQTTQKKIGDNNFWIKPFPAFTAAKVSGDLAAIITPLVGSLVPLLGNALGDDKDTDIMNIDIENVIPGLSAAFSSLSGDKFESMMMELLINHKNITVEGPETENKSMILDLDLANEVFCGELQDMYVLCFYVIQVNFKGFFKKIGNQFGSLNGLMEKNPTLQKLMNTEN